ncbi:MAG: ribonuclease HII [Clostridia bacterium]|nr:ribonuclease HII [Clostridia bacterium]
MMKSTKPTDLWIYERAAWAEGFSPVAGTDEAGRGPLAGPVFAAAVILPPEIDIPGLNDSKKLTEAKREALFPVITEKALAYAIAEASVEEIEELNILHAAQLAMRRAVEALPIKPGILLIDGNYSDGFGLPEKTIVKGDSLSASIAAASILAKVARDRKMIEYAKEYPDYGFEKHKGYPTEAHYAAIREHGVTPIHRLSFLKKIH